MYISYLALFSGLLISIISEYFSILGLTVIFPASPITVATMGVTLGIGKLTSTIWLKQNWNIAPFPIKVYLLTAICSLMVITSMGTFGVLSKAHSDQSLVSGDVMAKIAVFDEKIKIAKENIDANRKALKQLDEAVDQVMARSTTETGANRAVAIRRAQAKERTRLQNEIAAEQKTINQLSEERAPIAAEVRKVEAEVGPIKYIAAFVYGNTDTTILEKAVTWVIIIIIAVFDPLAVILLLASQISFQNFRDRVNQKVVEDPLPAVVQTKIESEPIKVEPEPEPIVEEPVDPYAYLKKPFVHFKDLKPMVYKPEEPEVEVVVELPKEETIVELPKEETLNDIVAKTPVEEELKDIPDLERPGDYLSPIDDIYKASRLKEKVEKFGYSGENGIIKVAGDTYSQDEFDRLMHTGYVQNEEQSESSLWKSITQEEYLKAAKLKGKK